MEKGQKFVMVQEHRELHITACAMVKNSDPTFLESFKGSVNYFSEPNARWLYFPGDEHAWIKIYHYLNPVSIIKTPKISEDQTQILRIPMKFFGKSPDDCCGEIQFTIKYKKNDRILKGVELGRNKSYDSRVGKWVAETRPIIPKNDQGSHGYVALRIYHEDYLPAGQPDWHFEPVYAVIGGENFYRIEAEWHGEEIIFIISPIPGDSPEIPKHILGFRELSSVIRKLK